MSGVLPRSTQPTIRDEIRASQRGRMLVAMCDVVAAKGYGEATVADVLSEAGVSRRTFYEHFGDKQACFLAAYDHGVQAMVATILPALAGVDTWQDRARQAITTFLQILGEEPGFGRAFLVEIWSAGPAALERHQVALDRFHALIRAVHDQARAQDASIVPATDAQIAAVTGGISRVATLEILAGRAAGLPELADELVDFAVAVLARRD